MDMTPIYNEIASMLSKHNACTAIKVIALIDAKREKVLSNKDDPSWTEHFAELRNEVLQLFVDDGKRCQGVFEEAKNASNRP